MSMIKVNNLSFHYDNALDYIFEDVSFFIDTNWKLGFIGRNGKGKTTFLNLLLGKYEYNGTITSDETFEKPMIKKYIDGSYSYIVIGKVLNLDPPCVELTNKITIVLDSNLPGDIQKGQNVQFYTERLSL